MTLVFIADTSILGSFAAARGLDLLLSALAVETIFIPPAVQHEIETGLARGVAHLQAVLDMMGSGNVQVLSVEPGDRTRMGGLPSGFGPGERKGVALCQRYQATLLCNDQKVVRYCVQQQITCFDLARLLRLLWLKNLASKAKIRTMIMRMEKAEHLVFKDVDRLFVLPHVVDRDDVRVVEPGRQARFLHELGGEGRIGHQVGRQHLERHRALQRQVARLVDDPEAALAEGGEDLVFAEVVRLVAHECVSLK